MEKIKKATIFEKILADSVGLKFKKNSIEARHWLRDKALSVKRVDQTVFVKSMSDKIVNKVTVGKMVMFSYDAKTKEQLPFFDRFPLIFPIEKYNDGFLGLNFHYLPPKLRGVLMDWLFPLISNKKMTDTSKLRISYSILGGLSKHPLIAPCIKRYLYTHVRSRFISVDPSEWQIAIHLPLEKFTVNKTTVFKATKKAIGISRR